MVDMVANMKVYKVADIKVKKVANMKRLPWIKWKMEYLFWGAQQNTIPCVFD